MDAAQPKSAFGPVRVLVVDDSALVRKLLTEMLSSDPGIEVVDTASNALIAREKIKRYDPDVLTLDVEMPKMDGLTFLGHLMRLRPMPVIMVSSLTQRGASVTLDALEIGAVDFIGKPTLDLTHALVEYADEVREKVRTAPEIFRRTHSYRLRNPRPVAHEAATATRSSLGFSGTDRIVALGASTGGTEALRDVIVELPGDFAGTVVTQHIPKAFSAQFASRLDSCSAMIVKEAEDGDRILVGHVYIAPGDRHLEVVREGAVYRCVLSDAGPVNRHKPSVDVMFRSVARTVGGNALGVLLTGMGRDGAQGLLEMKTAGARTYVQDEQSSVVWGMPGAAFEIGAADMVLPLEKIALKLRGDYAHRFGDTSSQQKVANLAPKG